MINPEAPAPPAPEPRDIDLLQQIVDVLTDKGSTTIRMRVQRQMAVGPRPVQLVDGNPQRDEVLILNTSGATIYLACGEDASTYSFPVADGATFKTSAQEYISAVAGSSVTGVWVMETSR